MKFLTATFFILLFALGAAAPARAQQGQVVQCGKGLSTDMSTQTADYCDLYTRQLDYMQKSQELRDKILQRQENYEAPRRQAVQAYHEALDELHSEKKKDSAPVAVLTENKTDLPDEGK